MQEVKRVENIVLMLIKSNEQCEKIAFLIIPPVLEWLV